MGCLNEAGVEVTTTWERKLDAEKTENQEGKGKRKPLGVGKREPEKKNLTYLNDAVCSSTGLGITSEMIRMLNDYQCEIKYHPDKS